MFSSNSRTAQEDTFPPTNNQSQTQEKTNQEQPAEQTNLQPQQTESTDENAQQMKHSHSVVQQQEEEKHAPLVQQPSSEPVQDATQLAQNETHDPTKGPFADKIQSMRDMGFTDISSDKLEQLFKKHKGNLSEVVNLLVQQ